VNIRFGVACLLLSTMGGAAAKDLTRTCAQCVEWNKPQKPFRIFGNTFYVGTHGLASILITSRGGHVLIDGALPESAKQIASNIRSLGFRVDDVKVIVNTHAHFDHAGGIAELQRLTGARVLASEWSAKVMSKGGVGRGDPQNGSLSPIAAIRNVHTLLDGEAIALGDISLAAHSTPGHTPGGTSWTWKSCENNVCHEMVYADSLSPVSAPGFKFMDSHEYPQALTDFEKSFAFLESTPCEILLTPHPEVSALWDRLEMRENGGGTEAIMSPGACRKLAEQGRGRLRDRVDSEHTKQDAKHD
jgi:metallo-beta-lactamase class B